MSLTRTIQTAAIQAIVSLFVNELKGARHWLCDNWEYRELRDSLTLQMPDSALDINLKSGSWLWYETTNVTQASWIGTRKPRQLRFCNSNHLTEQRFRVVFTNIASAWCTCSAKDATRPPLKDSSVHKINLAPMAALGL